MIFGIDQAFLILFNKNSVKMNKKWTVILLFAALLLGCKEEMEEFEQIEDGVVTSKSFIWRIEKTDARFARATVRIPTIIEGKFINSSDFNGEVKLAAYNVINGERAWEWDDFIEPPSDLGFTIKWPYVYEDRLKFREGNEGYGIDAVTR